ncbi:MAG: hypothetical protein AB7I27_17575 [Bacteriovoracaceae bacterium]
MIKNRRRVFLVNKKFQGAFVLFTLIPAISAIGTFYGLMRYYFHNLKLDGMELGLRTDHPYFLLLNDQQDLMNKIFFLFTLLMVLFFVIWGIWLSHKVAGPLYRLTKYFEEANGKPEKPLSFRPGDFFQEIPKAINAWRDRS